MTRLATLSAPPRPHSLRTALVGAPEARFAGDAGADTSFEDLKMFATGWLGGLVFFGTFLA